MDTAPEPVPPGEAGVEITGSEAFAALHHAFHEMTGPAKAHLSVKDMAVKKLGRWVLLTVRFRGKDANEVTIRMPTAWAKCLRSRLTKVLDR